MQRMGFMLGINAKNIAEYKQLHVDVWPEILQSLSDANITNYSIFLREPENLLFSYWEYLGEDFEADMKQIAALETSQKWWDLCTPCQKPLDTRKEGEWWAELENVFYLA